MPREAGGRSGRESSIPLSVRLQTHRGSTQQQQRQQQQQRFADLCQSLVPLPGAMQAGTTCGLSLLFAFLLGCSAFNLDPDSVVRRDGEPGSLFGFSMAMHRQLQPVDKAM